MYSLHTSPQLVAAAILAGSVAGGGKEDEDEDDAEGGLDAHRHGSSSVGGGRRCLGYVCDLPATGTAAFEEATLGTVIDALRHGVPNAVSSPSKFGLVEFGRHFVGGRGGSGLSGKTLFTAADNTSSGKDSSDGGGGGNGSSGNGRRGSALDPLSMAVAFWEATLGVAEVAEVAAHQAQGTAPPAVRNPVSGKDCTSSSPADYTGSVGSSDARGSGFSLDDAVTAPMGTASTVAAILAAALGAAAVEHSTAEDERLARAVVRPNQSAQAHTPR